MEKTKMGLPVALMAAITCLMGLYGGYVIVGILVGYILLKEENVWLKKTALKVLVILLAYSLSSTLLYLIPNCVSVFTEIASAFGIYLYNEHSNVVNNLLSNIFSLARTIILLLMFLSSLTQKDLKLPWLDDQLDAIFDESKTEEPAV